MDSSAKPAGLNEGDQAAQTEGGATPVTGASARSGEVGAESALAGAPGRTQAIGAEAEVSGGRAQGVGAVAVEAGTAPDAQAVVEMGDLVALAPDEAAALEAEAAAGTGALVSETGAAGTAALASEMAGLPSETGALAAAKSSSGGAAPVMQTAAEASSAEPGAGPVVRTGAEASSAEAGWAPSNWLLGGVAFVVAAADLGSKEWAKNMLAGPDLKRTAKHLEVVQGHMDFIFAQNPGGAWSFLRSVPDGLRRPFFLFVSAAAIVFIVSVYARLERRQWAMRWGLPLALGGAIGNLADRVRYGWVVDFIDVYWKRSGADEFHWPTFNVADIAIVFGVGLMAMDLFSLRRTKAPVVAEPAPETAGGAA